MHGKEKLMDSKKQHIELYGKLVSEQSHFKKWLLEQEPEEILKHTYEYTVREDIIFAFEAMELEDEYVAALLLSPCPLQDIYENYRKKETDYMDDIRCSIKEVAKSNM